MRIYDKLIQKIDASDRKRLLEALGYSSILRGERTLEAFRRSGGIQAWLSEGHYDFLHSGRSLLLRLGEIYFLQREVVETIEEVERREEILSRLLPPYLFVDTRFRRRNEPIFALAFAEGLRRISLDTETVAFQSLEETFAEVSRLVREHYRQKEGRLPLWGKIHSYVYHHTDGRRFRFLPDGTPATEVPAEAVEPGRATLSVGGREIDPHLRGE